MTQSQAVTFADAIIGMIAPKQEQEEKEIMEQEIAKEIKYYIDNYGTDPQYEYPLHDNGLVAIEDEDEEDEIICEFSYDFTCTFEDFGFDETMVGKKENVEEISIYLDIIRCYGSMSKKSYPLDYDRLVQELYNQGLTIDGLYDCTGDKSKEIKL